MAVAMFSPATDLETPMRLAVPQHRVPRRSRSPSITSRVALFEERPSQSPRSCEQMGTENARARSRPGSARRFFEARERKRQEQASVPITSSAPRDVAIAALERAARDPSNSAAFEEAIKNGRDAGVFTFKLKEYEKLFERQRVMSHARQQLLEAVESCNIELLDRAIQHCEEVGLTPEDLLHARRRHRMEKARRKLHEALAAESESKLDEAIKGAKAAGMEESERAVLDGSRALAKLRLADGMRRALEIRLRRHIDLLRSLIVEGEACRLDLETLELARSAVEEAEQNVQEEELCDICLENEANPLPCCGRTDGGGRICDGCLANVMQLHGQCPFCRGRL